MICKQSALIMLGLVLIGIGYMLREIWILL